MLHIETSTSLGSLQKFEGATGELKGALSSCHPLISSPVLVLIASEMNVDAGDFQRRRLKQRDGDPDDDVFAPNDAVRQRHLTSLL